MSEKEVTASPSAQLFDLRLIIALLFGVYGVVLTVLGFTGTDQRDLDRAGGINLNLWSGIGMLVLAALFAVWVLLRPLKLPVAADGEDGGAPRPH